MLSRRLFCMSSIDICNALQFETSCLLSVVMRSKCVQRFRELWALCLCCALVNTHDFELAANSFSFTTNIRDTHDRRVLKRLWLFAFGLCNIERIRIIGWTLLSARLRTHSHQWRCFELNDFKWTLESVNNQHQTSIHSIEATRSISIGNLNALRSALKALTSRKYFTEKTNEEN